MNLPLGLVTALESGNCVLFVGSGVGHNAKTPAGTASPDGAALASKLVDRYAIEADGSPDLAKVSQVVEIRKGRADLLAFLQKELTGLQPDMDLRWLTTLTWKAIFTTNYDDLIETCYSLDPSPTQQPVVIATNSEVKSFDARFEVPIYHLHGSLFTDGGRGAVLITEQDYATFRQRRHTLFDVLRHEYATTPILYVGYSHNDPKWRMVTTELRSEFGTGQVPPSFRLAPTTPVLDREILSSQGVETIDGNLTSIRSDVVSRLGDIRVDPRNMSDLSKQVPSDLRVVFDAHPAATVRLLNNWTYVNQANFLESPNTNDFLKGSPPNWGLIGQGVNFQRDIEEGLVQDILNFATELSPGARSHLLLGPAGTG